MPAKIHFFLALSASLLSPSVMADLGTDVDPSLFLGQVTDTLVRGLVETAVAAGEHRALFPADSLGLVPGVEAGMSVSRISIPASLTQALGTLGDTSQIPNAIPVPKLLLRKGLTDGVDLGFSGIGYSGYVMLGGDVQWTYMPRPDRPRVGARFNLSAVSLQSLLSTRSYSFEVVLAHRVEGKVAVFEPYIAPGVEWLEGEVDLPLTVIPGSDPALAALVPSRLSGRYFRRALRVAAGASLRVGWLRFVGEYSYCSTQMDALSLKVAFTWPGPITQVTNTVPDVGWSPNPRNTSF